MSERKSPAKSTAYFDQNVSELRKEIVAKLRLVRIARFGCGNNVDGLTAASQKPPIED